MKFLLCLCAGYLAAAHMAKEQDALVRPRRLHHHAPRHHALLRGRTANTTAPADAATTTAAPAEDATTAGPVPDTDITPAPGPTDAHGDTLGVFGDYGPAPDCSGDCSGMPVPTCGGSQDDKGNVQMEQEHGRPCKFPFPYGGQWYNSCTSKDSGALEDFEWCRVEFPAVGQEGPIRWALCNPNKERCRSNPVDAGKTAAETAAEKAVQDQMLLIRRFFEWAFWSPLCYCSMTLLFFSEVVQPFVHKQAGGHPFFTNAVVYIMQMAAFFFVACISNNAKAAGSSHILAVSTLCLVSAMFVALMLVGVVVTEATNKTAARDGPSPTMAIAEDFSEVLAPVGRVIVAFLLFYGVLEEIETKWAGMAAIGGLFVFGVAMASSSVISDIMAYFFIRMNGWFTEGDLIEYQGELVQVKDIKWRYTKAFKFGGKCLIYIPNGRLGNAELVNQSCDSGRLVKKDIPLDPRLTGAQLEGIVKDIWALLRSMDGKFTSLGGTEYNNQIDIGGSSVLLTDTGAAATHKELQNVTLSIKLKALYYYSKAPPWDSKKGEEPPWRDRQWDWAGPWNYQQEKVIIEVQKVLEKYKPAAAK